MRKFWIFLAILFIIVFSLAVACAFSDPFKMWFRDMLLGITGQVGVTVAAWWSTITANPMYQQWHMLIWFVGGVVGTVIFAKVLWPRRPHPFGKPAEAPRVFQGAPEPSPPMSIPIKPQNPQPLEEKKEETAPT